MGLPCRRADDFTASILVRLSSFADASVNTNIGDPYFGWRSKAFNIPWGKKTFVLCMIISIVGFSLGREWGLLTDGHLVICYVYERSYLGPCFRTCWIEWGRKKHVYFSGWKKRWHPNAFNMKEWKSADFLIRSLRQECTGVPLEITQVNHTEISTQVQAMRNVAPPSQSP